MKEYLKKNFVLDIPKRNRLLLVVFLLVLIITSFVFANSPQLNSIHEFVITNIDKMSDNVFKLVTVSSISSTLLTFAPGDLATPLSENLADLSDYLIIVLIFLWLQKYLFLSMASLALKIIVPLGWGITILVILSEMFEFLEDKSHKFKFFGVRVALFGMIIFGLVPITISVTNSIEDSYNKTIELTVEESNQIQSEFEGLVKEQADGEKDKQVEQDKQTETEETTEAPGDILGQISSFVGGTVDGAAEVATGVVDVTKGAFDATVGTLSQFAGNVMDLPNKMQSLFNNLINTLALLIVVNCIAPLLIFAGLIWMVQLLFGSESQKIFQAFGKVRPNKKIHEKIKIF